MKNILRPAQRGPGDQVLPVLLDLADNVFVLSVHLDYDTINLSIRTSLQPAWDGLLGSSGRSWTSTSLFGKAVMMSLALSADKLETLY